MTEQQPRKPAGFTYDGEWFDFVDEDDLLFAEAAAIEKNTGLPFEVLADKAHGVMATFALTWVSIKRRRPTFSWATATATLKIKDVQYQAEPAPDEAEEVEDPTPPAGQASAADAG